jgi:hypothetical protein
MFFLTTVIRGKDRSVVPPYMNFVKFYLKENLSLSIWLLETLAESQIF